MISQKPLYPWETRQGWNDMKNNAICKNFYIGSIKLQMSTKTLSKPLSRQVKGSCVFFECKKANKCQQVSVQAGKIRFDLYHSLNIKYFSCIFCFLNFFQIFPKKK